MKLNDLEKAMLEGDRGPATRKAMEILVQLGDIYGAERMVPIRNAHMPGASVVVTGKAGARFIDDVAGQGGRFTVPTMLNPAACDLRDGEQSDFDPALVALQRTMTASYESMGGIACHTCIPYFLGHAPLAGEHVAWGESSAIAYCNSVLGARTNREGGPSALAAALAGRVPLYGYHLDENRRPTMVVDVRVPIEDVVDYGTLGYFVGKQSVNAVPAFVGLPSAHADGLKMMSAALASSGAVALFHVAGVTPESPSEAELKAAGLPRVSYGVDEARETAALLDGAETADVDFVVLGCPHASVLEIRECAELLNGRRVHADVVMWLAMPLPFVALAERAGWARVIREAGVRIITDTCPVLGAFGPLRERLPHGVLATNSAKLAHYAPGKFGASVHYGDAASCVAAATTGRWQGGA